MVRRFFETGQLQHAVAHLAEAEAGDAEDVAFVGHDVGEELHVAWVDVHVTHDDIDLVDDGFPRSFDAEDAPDLHDGIGLGRYAVDALGVHASEEAVAFYQERIFIVIVRLDNCSRSIWIPANDNFRKVTLEGLNTDKDIYIFLCFCFYSSPFFYWRDINSYGLFVPSNVGWSQLEFLLLHNCCHNIFACNVKLKFPYGFSI